jgi:hypothetical protein
MNDVISTDLKENPKRFWAAIKSKKQESTGVRLDVLLALLKALNFLRVAFLMFPSTQG